MPARLTLIAALVGGLVGCGPRGTGGVFDPQKVTEVSDNTLRTSLALIRAAPAMCLTDGHCGADAMKKGGYYMTVVASGATVVITGFRIILPRLALAELQQTATVYLAASVMGGFLGVMVLVGGHLISAAFQPAKGGNLEADILNSPTNLHRLANMPEPDAIRFIHRHPQLARGVVLKGANLARLVRP